jgi:glycosyltransferase involved in cell wall biosynthesis
MSPPGSTPGACEIYRSNMPLYYLSRNGWNVRWEHFSTLAQEIRTQGREAWIKLVQQYDIFVLARISAPDRDALNGIEAFIELAHYFNKRVIYECDDDITNRYRDFSAMGIQNVVEIASLCDAITVTTPYLGSLMTQRTGVPHYVLPNSIDPVLWNEPEHHVSHPGITIGLSGSHTHDQDWRVLAEPLRRVLEKSRDVPVRLMLTAFHPDYLRDLPNTDYLPVVDYMQYAEIVRASDIVLAPLLPGDKFNLSKSPIKVIEGMGATRPVGSDYGGAACIATRHPVYALAIQHMKNGLLVSHNEKSWYNALDTLLSDHKLRTALQLKGHQWVWRNHNMALNWRLWDKAYATILRKPLSLAVHPPK